MSNSRTKFYRSAKSDLQNEKPTNTAVSRTAKWAQDSSKLAASARSLNQRSSSQPSSSTNLNKPRFRARSGGDEYKVTNDSTREEDYNEGLKLEPEQFKDDMSSSLECEQKNKGLEEDKDLKSVYPLKSSTSGIPLRIKSPSTVSSKAIINKKPIVPRIVQQSSTLGTCPNKPETKTPVGKSLTAKRALETQFQTKKKKFDALKKEILDKQKPLLEVYQTLVQIKIKLDTNSGKSKFPLEDVKIVNIREIFEEHNRPLVQIEESKFDPVLIVEMQEAIKRIPHPFLELCKTMMTKRMDLVNVLQKMSLGPIKYSELHLNVKALKDENVELQKTLDETFDEQEKFLSEISTKWETAIKQTNLTLPDSTNSEELENLQAKLKSKEEKLHHAMAQLEELNKKFQEINENGEVASSMLKDKIRALEYDQNRDKAIIQEQKEKNGALEQKLRSLKNRTKDADAKHKEMEAKLNEWQKQNKASLEQVKLNEERWTKEKEEMINKQKHEKQMLEKLSKDRAYFETSAKTAQESAAEWEAKYNEVVKTSRMQLDETIKTMLDEKERRETAENNFEAINKKLDEMEAQNKQALDLVRCNTTERETELHTELAATQVALKSAEEQIQNYNREKLRFIESIRCLQGDEESNRDFIAKTLIQNVEKTTALESKLAHSEEMICNQKIEIANLKVDAENLKQYSNIRLPKYDNESSQEDIDLKMMLHEGRMKLEQSLKKSLEYEHKIIKHEKTLNKQGNQICEMENLLKVRDGLITVMKAKKDELQMENDSLNKYANEIRDLLLQAKEEAHNRTELVHELTTNLTLRDQVCQKLEKKVRDLQGSLVVTNEKRFKLQETLGSMEKELQTTKASITKLAPELESRYGIDTSNFNNNCDETQIVDEHATRNTVKRTEPSLGVSSAPLLVKTSQKSVQNKCPTKRQHHATKQKTYTSLEDIEKAIDNLSSALEPMSSCILPDGGITKECFVNNALPTAIASEASYGFNTSTTAVVKNNKRDSEVTKLPEMVGDVLNSKNMENNTLVSNKRNIGVQARGLHNDTKILMGLRVNSRGDMSGSQIAPKCKYFESTKWIISKNSGSIERNSHKQNTQTKSMREYKNVQTRSHGLQPEKPFSPNQCKPPKSPRYKPNIVPQEEKQKCEVLGKYSQVPNPVDFERAEFINHTRNISRHINDRPCEEMYSLEPKKLQTEPQYTINCASSTEMEVRKSKLITSSLSKIKSELLKSIQLLSEKIL